MSNISKIALGTVQFGLDYGISNDKGKTPSREIQKILEYCNNQGINVLDTARDYGRAEVSVGVCDLSKFNVVSKFILENKDVELLLNNTLKSLNISEIYGYLYHRPMEVNLKSWRKLEEFKQNNIIEKIGFSFNTLDEVNYVMDNGFVPDLIQIPFNIFDNRFKSIALELKKKYNTEIHSRSTFLQGLFFVNPEKMNKYFDSIKHIIRGLQKEYNEKLATTLMEYVLRQDFIDKMVIGVNNKEQLKNNIESLKYFSSLKQLENIIVDEKYIIPSLWKV